MQFKITSKDGTELFCQKDVAENPKATVVIVHGLAEHFGRYDYLKDKLLSEGINVYRFDNRGHGRSGGEKGYVESFMDYVDDADLVVQRAKDENENLPVFLMGHSMGGFISGVYGIKYRNRVKGIVLSGAAVGMLPGFDQLEQAAALDPRTPVPNNLTSLICSDERVVKAYDEDPLVLKEYTIKLQIELGAGIMWILKNIKEFEYPCLIMHGGSDSIVPKACSENFYASISSKDKTLKIYDGMYHEILNEFEKDKVIDQVKEWLVARI